MLLGVPTFEQLYLIGDILGETLPHKLILSKCLSEWNPNGEMDMVDIGNSFYLIKFSNVIDRNVVLHSQPWFVGGQIFCLQVWRKNFDPIKEKIQFVLFGLEFRVFLLNCGMKLSLNISYLQLVA